MFLIRFNNNIINKQNNLKTITYGPHSLICYGIYLFIHLFIYLFMHSFIGGKSWQNSCHALLLIFLNYKTTPAENNLLMRAIHLN